MQLSRLHLGDDDALASGRLPDHGPAAVRRRLAILSRREREVLHQLLAGCSGPEVARRLTISPRTVEIHRQRIARKFGVSTVRAVIQLLNQSVQTPSQADGDVD